MDSPVELIGFAMLASSLAAAICRITRSSGFAMTWTGIVALGIAYSVWDFKRVTPQDHTIWMQVIPLSLLLITIGVAMYTMSLRWVHNADISRIVLAVVIAAMGGCVAFYIGVPLGMVASF